jgi:hypothetical protein
MEGSEVLLDFRDIKLSSSRLAVTLNQVRINSSGIFSVGMNPDEDNAIGGKMAEEGMYGGGNSAPRLGADGKVRQAWKEVSSRSNRRVTVGEATW